MPFPFIPIAVVVFSALTGKIAYDTKKKKDLQDELDRVNDDLNFEKSKTNYYESHETKPKDLNDDF